MLIPFSKLCQDFQLKIKGILHVGAHECEELTDYLKNGISNQNIFWVEAMPDKVELIKNNPQIQVLIVIDADKIPLLRIIKNNPQIQIFQALIDIEDNKNIPFYITNNGQSSSLLEFGSHATNHPHVEVVEQINLTTTRLDTLIDNQNIPIQNINFLNLDIQGVELRALKSMEKYLQHIDFIYTEVNSEEVYKKCDLIQDMDSYLFTFGFKRVATRMVDNVGWGDAFYIKTKE